uniref:Uncharacterized protein n=1 Tax=Lepeophtheirus salmonis TaxID=72036 RepID=A0A0K2T8W1_LEPSM
MNVIGIIERNFHVIKSNNSTNRKFIHTYINRNIRYKLQYKI